MSTCPDHELFSAYCDGEVPSPWKEKLERHIAECPECKRLTDRYVSIGARLKEGSPEISGESMESSYARLMARRAESGSRSTASDAGEWFRSSVRVPLPALAAMFLAAVILPSAITLGSRSKQTSDAQFASMPLRQMIAPGSELPRLSTISSPIFSDDLPELAVRWSDASSRDTALFTMVNYAQQFATDKNLIGDGDIVIIKLPNLARFGGGSDYPSATGLEAIDDEHMTLVRTPGK